MNVVFPTPISPYSVHLIALNTDDQKVLDQAEILYSDLMANGTDILFDDRKETPGVKLKDADLLGLPIRLIISKRSLENNTVELRDRKTKTTTNVGLGELVQVIKDSLR